MRIDWIKQSGSGVLLVFFNGWGMDVQAIPHLSTKYDLVVCSDYRSLGTEGDNICFSAYHTVYVVAWSMGVWAAANMLPRWQVQPAKSIALNGTELPIDNQYGIPVRSYELTKRGMTEQSREKFFARMFVNEVEYELFSVNKPQRILTEQIEELWFIHSLSTEHKNCINWNKVFISEKDLIFPSENQLRWWQNKTSVTFLPGGHYPFYSFRSWDELLDI